MSDVELTDAERDSLNECECGHFLNEHSSEGCLATVYDGDDGQASDDDQCLCVMSPAVWRLRAFEAILAARLSQERERLDVVVSANTEQARYIRELQGRLTEVASVAEDRGETIQALKDEAEQVRAERDAAMQAFVAGWFAHARNPDDRVFVEDAWHAYEDSQVGGCAGVPSTAAESSEPGPPSRPEADVRDERDREWRGAVEAFIEAAKPAVSTSPLVCTNACMDGPCDCDGVPRVLAWTLARDDLRALAQDGPRLAQEGEQ